MKKTLLILPFLFVVSLIMAQIENPVTWTMTQKQLGADEFELIFTADIENGWSIYSQHTDDNGPVPTYFEFDKGTNYQRIGEVAEKGKKKEGHDPLFDVNVIKFTKGPVVFTQKVKVTDNSKPITGYLTFMTCDEERCLPPTDVDFSFTVQPKNDTAQEENNTSQEKVDDVTAPPAIVEKVEKIIEELPELDKKTFVDAGKEGIIIPIETPEKKERKSNFEDPARWTYSSKKINDTEYELTFTVDLEEGWYTYSQFTPEGGPIPTAIIFDKNENISLLGKTTEKGKTKTEFEDVFGVDVVKFTSSQVVFTQKISVKDVNQPITGFIDYMVCNEGGCIPKDEEFAIDLQTGKSTVAAPIANNEPDNTNSTSTAGDEQYNFDKTLADSDCGEEEIPEEENASLWLIFLLGFGGGLVALLTPCVFPMIPLTVSFFTKSSKDKASGIRNALTYGLSIIVIYVALGLLITGVFGADALNLLSTNAWFNIFFAVLFIVFAFSFFGYFELTLPSSWANKSDRMADQGGLIGIFFMAFTLSLVSFSCTGPIIGTLLVETATGGGPTILGRIPVGPLMGMLGFSTALALPFALFAAFPSWLNSLPRSGSWMNIVKVTLGFVELALAMKFLSVADLTEGWKFMPYELFLMIWIFCALGLALYYFGFIRFPHDSPMKSISMTRKALGTALLLFTVYLGMGFRYSEQSETFVTPNILSGLAPPAGHSYIYPKKCPQNINCFKDFGEGLAYAKEQNKPILLDFTGHGCVNCRRMEDNVWSQEGVYDLISDDYVLISLYVDERTKLAEPVTSTFTGKTLRTVGNKWADFQAKHFDRNSQPYYVLLSEDGQVLNKPRAYTPDKAEYQNFLECGLERYSELKRTGSLE